jgi:parallel beta-helix repeat protein
MQTYLKCIYPLALVVLLSACTLKRQQIVIYETGATFTSFKEAIDAAKAGDSIIVYPGKYVSDADITLSKNYVSIVGVGKPQILCTSMQENVLWVQADHIYIKNIKASHIQPDFYANCVGNVFALDNAHDITIENCEINGCGRIGVYMFSASGVVLKNNWIHNNSLSAVQVDDVNLFTETDAYLDLVRFIHNRIEKNGDNQ